MVVGSAPARSSRTANIVMLSAVIEGMVSCVVQSHMWSSFSCSWTESLEHHKVWENGFQRRPLLTSEWLRDAKGTGAPTISFDRPILLNCSGLHSPIFGVCHRSLNTCRAATATSRSKDHKLCGIWKIPEQRPSCAMPTNFLVRPSGSLAIRHHQDLYPPIVLTARPITTRSRRPDSYSCNCVKPAALAAAWAGSCDGALIAMPLPMSRFLP